MVSGFNENVFCDSFSIFYVPVSECFELVIVLYEVVSFLYELFGVFKN